LISLVNITIDILNKIHTDDESVRKFMLILNGVAFGILFLVLVIKIIRIGLFYDKEYFTQVTFILFPVALGVLLGVLLGTFVISPLLAVYWVDVGLLCVDLHLKIPVQ
jgi:hypothetical protein